MKTVIEMARESGLINLQVKSDADMKPCECVF